MRDRAAASGRTPASAQPSAQPRRARDPDKVPDGYDPVAWTVAEAFLNCARKDDIPLAWGVPYLAKMFLPGVAATGLLSGRKIRNGNRKEIEPAEAGMLLVKYFWKLDLWEYECATGEQVAYRFAEPSNMRTWYVSLLQYWARRRLQKFGTIQPHLPEPHRNAPRRETS